MQKTAYEMRISDWSSDVCSSDLDHLAFGKGDLFERSAVFLARLARLRIDPPALINRNLQLQPDIAGGSLVAVARAGPGRERAEIAVAVEAADHAEARKPLGLGDGDVVLRRGVFGARRLQVGSVLDRRRQERQSPCRPRRQRRGVSEGPAVGKEGVSV